MTMGRGRPECSGAVVHSGLVDINTSVQQSEDHVVMTPASSASQFRWRSDRIQSQLTSLHLQHIGSEALTVAACHNLASSGGGKPAVRTFKVWNKPTIIF
jgi:hypothetical protein